VYTEAGVFRDGRERDRVFPHKHFLALHGGDLAGGHLEALGDTDNLFAFDLKFVKQIPQRNIRAFGSHVINGQGGIRGEIAGYEVCPIMMNAVLIYMFTSLISVGAGVDVFTGPIAAHLGNAGFLFQAIATLAVEWLILYWMMKRNILVKA
jgi:hypothetical protein